MSAPLIVTPRVYEILREAYGDAMARDLVTVQPPAHWPIEKPWPPQVALPAPPCWRCAAVPAPVSPLARLLPGG